MTTLSVFRGRVQQRGGEIPGPTVSYYVHKCNPHKRPTVYTHLTFTKGLLVPSVDCRPAKCLHFIDDETEAQKISGWKTIAGRAGTGSGTSDLHMGFTLSAAFWQEWGDGRGLALCRSQQGSVRCCHWLHCQRLEFQVLRCLSLCGWLQSRFQMFLALADSTLQASAGLHCLVGV